ncbi:MAG: Hsp20/alpha crystallin family protein [Flavobacteriaceae bacterium]|nr:Hsp20/alpha crystallin family protein [Flavobacteriaceae bacterium]
MLYNRNSNLPSIFDNVLHPSFFNEFDGKEMQHIATNIAEDASAYHLELLVPGWEEKDFEVSLENDVLQIEAKTIVHEEDKSKRIIRREFRQKQFVKRFQIPDDVDQDLVNVKYLEGILKFVLPKKEISTSKTKRLLKVGAE